MNKKEKAKLDKDWKIAIKKRDTYCQVCGPDKINKVLNVHHQIPKSFLEVRWDLDNGMLLCFQHHSLGRWSAHQNPVWFSKWLVEHKYKTYCWISDKLEELEYG